jgi:hypothetical protein
MVIHMDMNYALHKVLTHPTIVKNYKTEDEI